MNGAFQGGGGGSPGLGGGIFNTGTINIIDENVYIEDNTAKPGTGGVVSGTLASQCGGDAGGCSPVVSTGGNYGSINFVGGDGGLTSDSTTLATLIQNSSGSDGTFGAGGGGAGANPDGNMPFLVEPVALEQTREKILKT